MNPEYKDAFWKAASKYRCWIAVREPNPFSYRWIGEPNHTPKPVCCKAKTADNGSHPFAGLVVDPNICKDAFRDTTAAMKSWDEAFPNGPKGPYVVSTTRAHRGKLMYSGPKTKYACGAFLHSDFDLMTVVPVDEKGSKIGSYGHVPKPQPGRDTPDYEGDAKKLDWLATQIGQTINGLLNTPVIRHGPEFLYWGLGAAASEYLIWFGPDGEYKWDKTTFYLEILDEAKGDSKSKLFH